VGRFGKGVGVVVEVWSVMAMEGNLVHESQALISALPEHPASPSWRIPFPVECRHDIVTRVHGAKSRSEA
jgi:hypothetical protein